MNRSSPKIGYARTSTVDQNLDAQIEALTAAGCGMVRQEQRSGATLEGRPELKTILDFIRFPKKAFVFLLLPETITFFIYTS